MAQKLIFGDVLSAKRIVSLVFYAGISNSEKCGRLYDIIIEADQEGKVATHALQSYSA
jgi:hypothetical protein